jgi:ERCC4-related helicase
MSLQEGQYRHCDYQSMIAACALSLEKSFKIIVVPTGSGKTWI